MQDIWEGRRGWGFMFMKRLEESEKFEKSEKTEKFEKFKKSEKFEKLEGSG